MRSAALTYTLTLALVPALAVGISILHAVADVRKLSLEFKTFLFKNLTAGASSGLTKTIDSFLSNIRFKTIGTIGFLTLVFTVLVLISSIETSINKIWSIRKRRPLWKKILIYNGILIFGPLSLSLLLATITMIARNSPAFLNGDLKAIFAVLAVKANVGILIVNVVFLTLSYKIFPYKKVQWSAALFSAIAVSLSLELAKWAYAIYMTKALIYNRVYGGLAAVPFFLVWIYVNWNLFLGGALLSFVFQNYHRIRMIAPLSVEKDTQS